MESSEEQESKNEVEESKNSSSTIFKGFSKAFSTAFQKRTDATPTSSVNVIKTKTKNKTIQKNTARSIPCQTSESKEKKYRKIATRGGILRILV
ncbi:hypothetical protein BEWA_037930 [Theileria equi strain WA]|uniref:Uncharacterized protein n=1 Tax=Theileria equi strain WA TaxID=1537102 RepID=L1LEK6_THEEQ|nr:hypothetical protein BEWA_037930 [Theileria equi strain WA]EKX73756.1 hypothetical protein BEWA_037930 [Theileria equi strain WA]|eukprot:XP_004833208.1 hypothetical protein BEWA_037930 [Theileria equi strain WA]